ncbi:MAG: exonuclease domain-containing protein [Lachnospiraceae bacterium]|nr:exonuclease domain-containing protein [Lachnospiraceae bacterium]
MDYIVLDLEWNQNSPGRMNSTSLEFEIIEFGAVKLNEDLVIQGEFHEYISPRVFYRMHYKTKEVTGISMKDLKKNGRPFYDVARDFFAWCGQDVTYVTWGDMDLTELQRNCEFFGYPKVFAKPLLFIDLQKLYSLQFGLGKKRLNLRSAVEERGIPETDEYHSAISDARYTARIMQMIDMKTLGGYKSVDYHFLPQTPEEEYVLNFGTYSKYVSREFKAKEDAFLDRKVTATSCHLCGRETRKKIGWFTANGHSFYSVSSCPEHGLVKSKIRIKKGHRGGIFVVKTEKLTTDTRYKELKEKQKEVQKRKQLKKRGLLKRRIRSE